MRNIPDLKKITFINNKFKARVIAKKSYENRTLKS